MVVNKKHRKILDSIFENPIRSNMDWKEIESLFLGLGAEISEGRGSRMRVILNGVRIVIHRPHPRKEVGRETLKDVRDFLTRAGIE